MQVQFESGQECRAIRIVLMPGIGTSEHDFRWLSIPDVYNPDTRAHILLEALTLFLKMNLILGQTEFELIIPVRIGFASFRTQIFPNQCNIFQPISIGRVGA